MFVRLRFVDWDRAGSIILRSEKQMIHFIHFGGLDRSLQPTKIAKLVF